MQFEPSGAAIQNRSSSDPQLSLERSSFTETFSTFDVFLKTFTFITRLGKINK